MVEEIWKENKVLIGEMIIEEYGEEVRNTIIDQLEKVVLFPLFKDRITNEQVKALKKYANLSQHSWKELASNTQFIPCIYEENHKKQVKYLLILKDVDTWNANDDIRFIHELIHAIETSIACDLEEIVWYRKVGLAFTPALLTERGLRTTGTENGLLMEALTQIKAIRITKRLHERKTLFPKIEPEIHKPASYEILFPIIEPFYRLYAYELNRASLLSVDQCLNGSYQDPLTRLFGNDNRIQLNRLLNQYHDRRKGMDYRMFMEEGSKILHQIEKSQIGKMR